MSRKVFLSFVGLSEYITCNYYFNGNEQDKSEPTRFIQEAIIKHECSDWNENDGFYFFATPAARASNWENGIFKSNDDFADIKKDTHKDGLKKILNDNIGLKNFNIVSINNGSTESEIWEIFHKISDCIQPEDCIYLDITHAFRSLPMLGIVILNYLKAIKNISVGEIYYGAFEKLGNSEEVQKKELEDRNAPVLKLRSFNDIMNFSFAAKLFTDYGNADLLCQNINETWTNPKTDFERKLRSNLSKKLEEISMDLQTCRGGKICDGDSFRQLYETFNSLEEIERQEPGNVNYKALGPILKNIKEKFKDYSTQKDVNNGFVAAQWCFDHGMYQQSATMLQETIVSYCTSKVLPYNVDSECQTHEAKDCRELIESYLQFDPSRKSSEIWKDNLDNLVKEHPSFSKEDIEEKLNKISALRSKFQSLTTLRNNLNHAGFVVKKELGKGFEENQKTTTAKSIVGKEKNSSGGIKKILSDFKELTKEINL